MCNIRKLWVGEKKEGGGLEQERDWGFQERSEIGKTAKKILNVKKKGTNCGKRRR